MSTLPMLTRAVLATYPPSFKDRYGAEQQALLEDLGTKATTGNLIVGSLRAWVTPSFGEPGPEWRRQRLLATASTVWVMWVGVFFAGLAWIRLIGDPIVPEIRGGGYGFTLYRWAVNSFYVGVIAMAILMAIAFVAVLVSARKHGTLRNLKPLVPLAAFVAFQAVGLYVLSRLAWTGAVDRSSASVTGPDGVWRFHFHIAPWYLALLATWLLLSIPLAYFGARQPVKVLRESEIVTSKVRYLVLFALLPVACLLIVGVSTFSLAILEIAKSTVQTGAADVVVATGLFIATVIACTSYVRAMPSTVRSPMVRD
jgi:hypothetical protein